MKITKIYEDDKTVVKSVECMGKFLYTVTYKLDADGFCDKMIRVYADGTVETR